MTLVDMLGLAAATLTTGSFIPQIARLWRTKDASGISLVTFAAFSVGIVLWLAYGLLLRAWPIVVANVLTLCLTVAIVMLTLRYRRPGKG
jgi:MtN3 and saliva related transmembrane protein